MLDTSGERIIKKSNKVHEVYVTSTKLCVGQVTIPISFVNTEAQHYWSLQKLRMQVVSSRISKEYKPPHCFTSGSVLENTKTFGRLLPPQLQCHFYQVIKHFIRKYVFLFSSLIILVFPNSGYFSLFAQLHTPHTNLKTFSTEKKTPKSQRAKHISSKKLNWQVYFLRPSWAGYFRIY